MKITTQIPVDSTAARVVSKGYHYNAEYKYQGLHAKIQPPIMEPTKGELGNPIFVNLEGFKFGHFIVIGKSAQYKKKWIVRCDCGTFEARTKKAITNTKNKGDRCAECFVLASLRRREHYRLNGEGKETRDF